MPPRESPWTDDRLTIVRRMAAGGYSALQIGDELGFTRNAIIGLCRRRGIELKQSNRTRPRRPGRPQMRAPVPAILPPSIPIAAPAAPAVSSSSLEIVDLENHHCRWPLTSGRPWLFCAVAEADVIGGAPYCREHATIAYNRGRR
jgi:hypothetical protein